MKTTLTTILKLFRFNYRKTLWFRFVHYNYFHKRLFKEFYTQKKRRFTEKQIKIYKRFQKIDDLITLRNVGWLRRLIFKLAPAILLMLTLSGSAQYINLEWPMRNVKAQNRDKELIWSAPDYLEYKTLGGYIAYEFTDKVCTAAYICLDSIAGDSLINSHLLKNWQPIAPDQWLYYAGYDVPVKVTADWFWQTVTFKYTLKN